MHSKKTNTNRLIMNTLYLYILTFSNYLIGLLLYPYLSRVLTIEGFGLVGFSMAYTLIYQLIVEFGFMISATARISEHRNNPNRVSEIVSSVMYAKFILLIVSAILFLFSAYFISIVRDNLQIVSLFFISGLISALMPDFFFRGIEKMKPLALRTIFIRTLSLLLVVALVRDESQILLIPTSFIIGNTIALVVTIIAMRKAGGRLIRTQTKQAIISIKDSFMFFLSRVAASLNQSAGTFLIGLKYSPASVEAGIFAGASRISLASEMMLMPVSDSLFPHMVSKKDYRLFRKVIIVGGVVWFFVCLLIFLYADEICRIILGPNYTAAGDLLRILLFGNFIAFFSNMFGYNALVPIGKSNQANIALFVSGGFSLIAYGTLWFSNSINLVTICAVMASIK